MGRCALLALRLEFARLLLKSKCKSKCKRTDPSSQNLSRRPPVVMLFSVYFLPLHVSHVGCKLSVQCKHRSCTIDKASKQGKACTIRVCVLLLHVLLWKQSSLEPVTA